MGFNSGFKGLSSIAGVVVDSLTLTVKAL